jgi:hypothetical protein
MPKKRKSKSKKVNQKGGADLPSIDMSGNLGTILDNSLKAAEKIFYTPNSSFLMKDFINLGEDSWSLFKDVIGDLGVD